METALLALVASLAPGPSATRGDDGVVIRFSVDAPADVEVSIIDAAGGIVRHLAAGVLGREGAPPAPLAPGLSQRLEWDGRDDLGRPAKGGPFRVRVRTGTRAVLGAVLGDPGVIGSKVYGLATDGEGALYVASGGGYGDNIFTIRVFDRSGAYRRTIFPYPANLRVADVDGFGKQTPRDGKLNPPQFHGLLPWIYPNGLGGLIGNRVQNGVLWMTNGRGEICRIRAADGACVSWGGTESPAPPAQGPIAWASAPDGRSLFLAGWYHKAKGIADGQVFRVDPSGGKREPFARIDVPADAFWAIEENGWYNFTNWGRKNGMSAIHGVAVDESGRVYACDRVNQRIAVYDASGSLLGETAVEWPDLIALGRGEEIYVTTRKVIDGYKAINEVKVLKLSGWKDGRILASLALAGRQAPSMAVDVSGDPAIIWLSLAGTEEGPKNDPAAGSASILRIEERDGKFLLAGRLGGADAAMPEAVVKVWADPRSEDIIVSDGWSGLVRLDGRTGERKPFPLKGIDLAFGPDGYIYVYGQAGWHELIARFDRNFNAVPFPATGKNTTALTTTGKDVYGRYGHGWSNKGIAVALSGRIYAHNMYDWHKYFVNVWDPSGRAERHAGPGDGLVGPTDPEGGGLCVDAAGNVYVGLHGGPADAPPAPASDGQPTTGAIVKFGPAGGGYAGEGDGIPWAGSRVGDIVRGAIAVYPGLGPQTTGGCVCKEARFDMDPWGRLVIPNAVDYRVRMIDNAGNEILRFGSYGNADSRGPGSAVPDPEIPLGWPICASAGRIEKGWIYVADALNRRVVRVDLRFATEESCPIE
ncbi:MAG: hypothetical protein JXP34_25670 [Planctomycetes bacterium]|nr:hypothetical protein [Planctomycetota bacterium]